MTLNIACYYVASTSLVAVVRYSWTCLHYVNVKCKCSSFIQCHMQCQRRFLLTIYIALLPKGACGSAGWVSNTTHYNCCHYRHYIVR